MKQKSAPSLTTGRAYQVFRVEIGKHLSSAQELISSDSALDGAQLKKLSANFHTIRGGAGFFGLTEISECAHQLEELFAKTDFDFVRDMAIAHPIFQRLKECAAEALK